MPVAERGGGLSFAAGVLDAAGALSFTGDEAAGVDDANDAMVVVLLGSAVPPDAAEPAGASFISSGAPAAAITAS